VAATARAAARGAVVRQLTPALVQMLRANADARRAAPRRATGQQGNSAEPDVAPVLKLFNPCGAATWLATELDDDDDTLFGLADLGFGCPELGSFSLCEIDRTDLAIVRIRECTHACQAAKTPFGIWVIRHARSASPDATT
jgi:hypothetical protein